MNQNYNHAFAFQQLGSELALDSGRRGRHGLSHDRGLSYQQGLLSGQRDDQGAHRQGHV